MVTKKNSAKAAFGRRLAEARKAARLNQRELRESSKVPQSVISKIENGLSSPDRVARSTIEKLATSLKVDPVWLATGVLPKEESGEEPTLREYLEHHLQRPDLVEFVLNDYRAFKMLTIAQADDSAGRLAKGQRVNWEVSLATLEREGVMVYSSTPAPSNVTALPRNRKVAPSRAKTSRLADGN